MNVLKCYWFDVVLITFILINHTISALSQCSVVLFPQNVSRCVDCSHIAKQDQMHISELLD